MFGFLQNENFKKAAFFLAVVAGGATQVLPPHTVGYAVSLGITQLAAALGIISSGTQPKK